jgi:hypothetical protein
MHVVSGRLRRLALGIPVAAARVQRRGFVVTDPAVARRIEAIGGRFLEGYHAALERVDAAALARRLDEVEPEERGWAYEGAGMALALLDVLLPWGGDRFGRFAAGAGAAHVYMLHVGAGWALARLPVRPQRALRRRDPLLRWLALDGMGFHEGYFRWGRYAAGAPPPRRVRGYGRRAFDQGLGRSLWFVQGAAVDRIARAIGALEPARHPDLWSGVGLACAYAGGAGPEAAQALRRAAGPWWTHVAQGAAFAAKARQRAGNPAPHTDLACRILCGCPAEAAADITDRALPAVADPRGDEPAIEAWRSAIRRAAATRPAATHAEELVA